MFDSRDYEGKRLFTEADGMNYVGLHRSKFRKWAAGIGAVRHIGRRVLYDRIVIDRAIDAMQADPSDVE